MFDVMINDRSVGCSDYVESFATLDEAKAYIMSDKIISKGSYFVVESLTDKEVWYYGQDEEESEVVEERLDSPYDVCYMKGLYDSELSCSECEHRFECSGSDADDE